MKYLLDRGGNPRKKCPEGFTLLHAAAAKGLCEPLKLLLSEGHPADITLEDHSGTPLHAAASKGQDEAMKILLEHGADPNRLMDHHITPLMLACCRKSLECMKLLIEAGADVNSSYCGPTSLTQAIKIGFTDIVKFLLEAGADPNDPGEDGEIPIQLAAKRGDRDLVEFLFSKTNPVPSLPYWSVDGIIRMMESPLIRLQDAVPVGARVTDFKSRAKEAFRKKDYQAALYFFGRVIEINPFDATMFSNRSLCWLRMGEGERALSDAQRCRQLMPGWCKGWYLEGTALEFMEDYQGAADAFTEALKLNPESDEIKRALGMANNMIHGDEASVTTSAPSLQNYEELISGTHHGSVDIKVGMHKRSEAALASSSAIRQGACCVQCDLSSQRVRAQRLRKLSHAWRAYDTLSISRSGQRFSSQMLHKLSTPSQLVVVISRQTGVYMWRLGVSWLVYLRLC
ncbi:hypothetical protein QYE76_068182 [Lolium multiflorum]|uniref:Serine/threonine-protein kinase BSK1-like TPR repeats domain-containing protein n=1 Tax=Lolium multiflorum TaxID=4521 RepID=A0AAD8SDY8_LOLMU|nr:hypothetical protein QYE76_068182 [Lolium multiflorum]